MMLYNNLAKYYDVLLKDDEATLKWAQFFSKHHYNETVLELASGTGEITLEVAKDFNISASDVSVEMLNELKHKDISESIQNYYTYDLYDLNIEDSYDNIICFCDSVNYILNYDDLNNMFKSVYKALNNKGVFMFDMHTKARLDEFKDGFIETGNIHDTDYQWTINSDEDYIYHHFVFYEEAMLQEYHTQMVFDLETVKNMLVTVGFEIEVYSDHDALGLADGEKTFIVGRKIV